MTISPEQEAEIERLSLVERWPVGTIASQLGIHHETVERVLQQRLVPIKAGQTRARLVDDFIPFIQQMLAKYPAIRASRLHSMCKARGYTGSKSGFRPIVAKYRPIKPREAFVRRQVLAGEEGQIDWGYFGKIKTGRAERKLWAFVVTLSYSRKRFVWFSMECAMPAFLRGHVKAFEYFGGVFRQGLYDNLKSAVLERHGDAIRFHPSMLALARHYHFEPKPCNIRRGNEKGRVERSIRDIRDNFFVARQWVDLDDLNRQALAWCEEIAQERVVPDNRGLRVCDAYEQEKAALVPLPAVPFDAYHRVTVHVGKTPWIRFESNDYSVPPSCVRKTLELIACEKYVRILDGTVEVARHERCYDRDQRIDYREHLEQLVKHKLAARKSSGFDRLFAAVPSSRAFMQRVAEQGGHLGGTTASMLKLLNLVGARHLEQAVAQALALDVISLGSIHHILDTNRRKRGESIPVAIPIENPLFRDVAVTPHALSSYDRLCKGVPDHE